MDKLMLDTNAVRALLDGRSPRLDGWFSEKRCCLSAIEILPWSGGAHPWPRWIY